MKKAIAVISLIVLFLCGCGADPGSVNVTSVPQASRMVQDAQASVVNFTIPREMKVFVRPDELTPLKPLFGSYLKGNDMLLFAVSAVFDGSAYLMGFVYENNEGMLPFSRVIGLKQNGTGLEEAFISDNYKPDPANIPENLIEFMDEPFYDTQAFKIGGMLAVKTNECLEVDEGLYNFFLISEDGLLDNHIDTDLNGYCELFEYNGKLLLNENYIWYEFTVKNKKITLKEITDYKPYLPEISKSYFVITINDFKPNTYDENTCEYKYDSYIEADIDRSEIITKKDFNNDPEDFSNSYLSKKIYKIGVGDRIILLYSPDIRVDCFISGDMGDAGFERLSVPGAELLRAQKPGEYTAQIYNDTFYLIYITAE